MARALGIEFAPLSLPVERRLQTAAILAFLAQFWVLGPLVTVALLSLLFTPFFFIPCLYAAWYFYDRNSMDQGGRKWTPARHWKLWDYFRDYFPIKLVKTSDLDPGHNYMMVCHPHGILASGVLVNFGSEANKVSQLFPGIRSRILTLRELFILPGNREIHLLTGACSVNEASIEWLLTREGKGNALVIVPGGSVEVLDAVPGKLELTLKRRKGFCRLALKHGAHLVPVLSFGENDVYNQIKPEAGSLLRKIQEKFTKTFRFSPPLIYGRGIFQYTIGLLPYRKPITTGGWEATSGDQGGRRTDERTDQ
ncbi:2-acylglycerol O-acyltransferase 2 [Halotydeus destructor]|nr:2-acylglycerol O-acyltransferase 2 [Halotydeus destructor]